MFTPGGSVVKNPSANAGNTRNSSSVTGLGRSPGVGNGNPLLVGYSPWGHKESDTTEHASAEAN